MLATDPGLATGMCLVRTDGLHAEPVSTWEVAHRRYGFVAELLIATYRPAVVIEDFLITSQTGAKSQAPWSLKQIGVAEYLAWKYGCPFYTQTPKAAKDFATNDQLRNIGWYVKGQDHGRDAQRHALLHLVRSGWMDERLKG